MVPRDVTPRGGPDDDVDPSGDTVACDEQESAYDSFLHHLARAPDPDDAAGPVELTPGVLVADRFEIEQGIGRGGFAMVYRARDRVLSRPVALKFLARRRLCDRDLELFYREARATARLNHVHIVTVFDWGEWNGSPFLVLELLEGETLAAVLARGRLPEARAWAIARAIARGLAHAHAQGVLHLDLKSQNVFVLRDGRIKVLDFGLAGLEWQDDVPGGIARIAGGTPATMAPEQEHGGKTDARTDVWAVGVIFYQMLFGELPDRTAPTVRLPPGVSRPVEELLRRTLALDPAARFADAPGLLAALDAGGAVAPRRPVVLAPEQHRQLSFSGDVFDAELSPDGEWLAWIGSGRRELWVQQIDSDQPQRIFVDEKLVRPRWFPDSARILLSRAFPRPPVHWIVPVDRTRQGEVPFRDELAVVLADGASIAACGHGFVGPPKIVLAPLLGGEGTDVPLPEGCKVVVDMDAAPDGSLLVTTFDRGAQLWRVHPASAAESLHRDNSWIGGARWDRDGTGVFLSSGDRGHRTLRWMPVTGGSNDVVTLFDDVALGEKISVSSDGRRVLYHRENNYSNLVRVDPTRDGATTPLTAGTAEIGRAAVSPDGGSLVYAMREGQRHAIVVAGVDRDAPRTRVARSARPCAGPVWSPDGRRIALKRAEGGGWRIVIIGADGDGEQVLPWTQPSSGVGEWIGEWVHLDWLSSTRIVYTPENNGCLRVADLETGVDRVFLSEPATGWMFSVKVSPEATRVAFYWNRGEGPTRGIYLADPDGSNARLVVPGRRMPIGWTDGGAALLVAPLETAAGDVSTTLTVAAAIEKANPETGVTTVLWRPPEGFDVVDASVIPGSDQVLVVRGESKSDAWLLEDPPSPLAAAAADSGSTGSPAISGK